MTEFNTPELSDEEIVEIEEYCKSLAAEANVSKVHAVVFIDPANNFKRTRCFLKEPNFPTKLAVLDKVTTIGMYKACEELREATVLREKSDAITYGDSPECEDYKLGVVNFCVGMIKTKHNVYKKK